MQVNHILISKTRAVTGAAAAYDVDEGLLVLQLMLERGQRALLLRGMGLLKQVRR